MCQLDHPCGTSTMYLTIAFVVGVLGHFCSGVPIESAPQENMLVEGVPLKDVSLKVDPLESPSSDFSKFFSERIIGGIQAADDKAPHMVALVVDLWFVCGGSIITEYKMLTAAHCVMTSWNGTGWVLLDSFHAVVGSNTWYKGTKVPLIHHKLHPRYDSWSIKNDIALLTAKDKIQWNDQNIANVAIPLNFGTVEHDTKCFVTGWGTQELWGVIPELLQILYVRTVSAEQCARQMIEVAGPTGAPPVDAHLEICTYHSPGHGTCHGDSGSALVCNGMQVGIVSWGLPCARGAPDVYARVGSAEDFILDYLGASATDQQLLL